MNLTEDEAKRIVELVLENASALSHSYDKDSEAFHLNYLILALAGMAARNPVVAKELIILYSVTENMKKEAEVKTTSDFHREAVSIVANWLK